VRSHCVTQCFPCCFSLPCVSICTHAVSGSVSRAVSPCPALRPPASQCAPGLILRAVQTWDFISLSLIRIQNSYCTYGQPYRQVNSNTTPTNLASASISFTLSFLTRGWYASTATVHHSALATIISTGICDGLQQVFVGRGPPAQPSNLWLAAPSNHSSIASMSAQSNICSAVCHLTAMMHYNRSLRQTLSRKIL